MYALALRLPLEADVGGELGASITGDREDVRTDSNALSAGSDTELNHLGEDTNVTASELRDDLKNLANLDLGTRADFHLAAVQIDDLCSRMLDDFTLTPANLAKVGRAFGWAPSKFEWDAILEVTNLLKLGGGDVARSGGFHAQARLQRVGQCRERKIRP